MDEDHHTTYIDGDIVWVKLGPAWWPGQVKDLSKIPSDKIEFKKPPLVLVKFFEEDSYEYVRKWGNIYPYNCEKKIEFIKKGMAAFRSKATHMETFPKDVTTAEVMVGGNPNILSEPQFRPEVKRNYVNEIFGTPNSKKRTNTDNSIKRSTTKTQLDTSHITHRRFLGSDDYKAYICIQYPGKDRIPDSDDEKVVELKTEPEREYDCHTCSYSTKRLEVMILHIKSHIQFEDSPPIKKRKKPVTPKPKKKEPAKSAKRQRMSASQLNDTSNDEAPEPPKERKKKTKTSPSVKKSPKVVEEVKPKNSSDIRNDLLAEWDDEEDELTETENMSITNDLSILSANTTTANDLSILSENTTTANDLSILSENTTTAIDQILEPINEPEPEPIDKPEPEPEGKTTENEMKKNLEDDKESAVGEELSPTNKTDDSPKIGPASSGDTNTQNDVKCCFDFNDEEEEVINTTVQVGRKIPRVIPPTEKRKSEILDDIIDLEEGFNKEEILKVSQSFNEKHAENNELESAFKDLMDEVSVPKISELENSLKPTQNFHSVKTIKFPDKQDGPPKKDRDKNRPDVHTEPINPKKRFVKNFEEFENQLQREKVKSKKQQALKKKSRKEILLQGNNDDSSDKTSDDDCKDLPTKIMSSILDEAKISEESKEKIMSKLNKSTRGRNVDSCSTDSNAEVPSPSEKADSKGKQKKFDKNVSTSEVVDINTSHKNQGRIRKFFRKSTELNTVDMSKSQQQEPTVTDVRCTNKTEESLIDDTNLKQQEIGTSTLLATTASVYTNKMAFKKRSLRSSSEFSILDKSHHIEPVLSPEIVYSSEKDDKKRKKHDKHKKIQPESMAGVDDSGGQKEKEVVKDLSHTGATRRQHYSLSEINVETSNDQKEALINVDDKQDQAKAISKTRKSLRNYSTEKQLQNETVHSDNVVTGDITQEKPSTVTNEPLGVNNAENKVVFSQDFYIRDNSKKETLPRKKRKFVTDSFSEASVDQLNVHSGVVAHQERVIDTLLEETLPLKRRRSLRVSSSEAATKDTAIIHQGKEELNTTIAPTNASNDDSTEKNQKGKDSSDKTRWSKRISHPKKRTRSFPDNFDIVETKPAVNENITVTDDSQNLEVKESVIVSIDHEQNERPSELGDTENKKETVDFTENTGAETHEELNDSKTQISDCVPHESATNNVETESESEPLQIRVEEEDAVYLMDNKEPKLITENAALLDSNSLKLQEDVALQSSSEILVNDHKSEETEQEPVQQCTGDEKNVVREVCISESENISVIDRITDGQDHPIPSDNLNVDVDTNDRLSKKQRRNKRKSSKHKHKKKGKTSKEYYRNVELRNDSDIESCNIEVNPSKTPIGDSVVEEVSNFSQSAQSEAEIVNKEAATIKEVIIEKKTVDLTEEIDYIPEHEPVTDENYISMTESKEITSTKQSTENQFSEIKETNELIVTDEANDSCVDKEKPLHDETQESTEFVDQTERDSAKVQESTEPEIYLTHDEQPPKELIKTQKSSILGVISSDEEELIKKYLTPEEPSEEHTLEKPVVTQEVTVDNFCGSTEDGFDLSPEVSFKKQTLEEPVVTQEATVPEDLSVSKKEEVEVTQEATIPEDLSVSKEEEFNFSPEVQEQTVEEPIITQEATVPEDLSVSKENEFNTSPEVQLQEQTLEELVVTQEETIPEDLSVSKEEEYNLTPEVPIKEQTLEEPVVIQEETILEDFSITKEEVNLTPSELSEEQVNEGEPSVTQEVTPLETLSREEHVVTKEEELLDNIPVSNEDEFNFTVEVQSEKQLKDEEDVLSQEVTTLEQPAISNEQFDVVSEAESEELPHEEPVVIEETSMHLQKEEYNITTEKPVKPCPTNEDFYLPLDRKVEEQPQQEEPIVTQEEPISEEPFSTNEEIILTEEESIKEPVLVIHDAQQEEPVDSSEELTLQLEKEPSEGVAADIEDTLVEKDFEHDVEGINRSPQQPEFFIEEQSPEVRETLIIEEPVDSNEQALDLTQDLHSEKQVPFAFDEKESKFDQNETSAAEAFAPKEENIMVNEEAEFMKQPHVLMDEQKSTVTHQIENLETPFGTKADATEILQPVEEPQLIEEVIEEICDTPEEKLTVIHKNKSIEEHVEVPAKLPTEIQPTELELHSINKTETTVIKKLKSRFYEITGLNVHQEPQLNQSGTDNSGVTNAAHLSVIQKASDIVDDEKLDAIQGTQANNEVTVIQELIQEPQLDVIEECVVHEDIQSSVLSEPADEVPRSSTPTDEYAVLKSATSKEQLTNEKLLDTNEEGNQYRTKLSAIEECLEKPIAHQEFGVTSRREIVFHETPKQSNSSDDSEDLTVKKIIDSSVKDQDKLSKKLPDSIFKVPASLVSKSEVRYKKNTFEHRPELKKGMNFTDLDEVDENITDLVSDIVKKLNQDGSDKNQEDLDIELEEEIIDISAKSRSPKVDLSKVLQNDMLTASFEDDPCRIKNYIEPSYSESITGLEKSGENSQSPIENKTENTQRVEEYSKELEIHCANSNDSFKFCIQTNLSNLSRSEEISAIALATMSELKCDSEPATINNNVPADDLPKPDMFSEKLSETEMAAIEGNLTVMSEKDLGDAQVEITSEKVISPKKPVTLSSFSMDFSESTSENDKNLEKNSKGTEFTSRAITKELKPRANVKKINAYNQGELLDILEGNDPSKKAPELQSQPKIVEDVECDFDEIISKNLISKDGVKSVDEESKSSPFSSKLFDRLLDGKSDSAGQEPATETLPKQKSKSKPVILSEKIIKAAPENKKVIPSSDSIVNDDDDLKTFVIQNIKKHIEEDDPVPASKPIRKSRAKPSCKAKILQQTIITPSGEVLQPTGCLPKKKTILISPTTSTVSARVSVEGGPSQTAKKTQIITGGTRPTITTPSTSQDDNVFDIYNMPIVLSDQILTPESIESMPIVIDNNASTNARTQPSTLQPTSTSTKLAITKPATYTRTAVPTKTIAQPQKTITKPRILQAAPVKQPIPPGKVLAPGVLPRGAKPGTYFFLSQGAPGSSQQKVIAKKTIVKRNVPIANIASKFPEGTGNKVMIVTDQQGQQQRVLFNPNNQRLLSYSTLSGSKIVKNVLKSNLIQKNVSSVIKNEVGPTKSPTQIVQKVLPTSNQMISVPSTSRTVKTVVRKVSPSTSKLPTTVKNSKTILLTGKNGQTIKKIAVAEDDIDKQVAEQLEAIKASSGLQFGSQTRSDVPSTSKQPIQKPAIRRSYAKKDFKPKPPVVTTISETLSSAPPPLIVSKKQTVSVPEPKKAVQVQEEPPVQVERPLQQMLLEQPDGTLRTITEGEIYGFPSESISGEPNSFVFMTLDSTGNLVPVSNEVLRKLSPNLAIDGDTNNYVLQIDNGESNQPATLSQAAVGKNSNPIEELSTGTPKVDNAKIELPLTLPITIGQPQQQSLSLPITIEHQRPQQQSLSIPLTIEHQRPQQQSLHVLQPQQSQQEQHITSLTDTPVMNVEVASSNGDQPQHILVSGDDLATQKFLETLSGNKLDLATLIANAEGKSIVIQTVNQEIIINTSTDHPMLSNVTENTESGRNPIFATHSNKTDILAAALADTDVFSTQPSRGAQLSPNNALYPINVGNVLETSLTLSSPIMTPLEVPSTNNKKISEDEADILTQVPKNVDLPITITDPNISQTVANQQVALMGNEFQSNLELGLSIAETTISSVTTGLTSPSYSYSLPSLDENDISHKPFNSSMPLLNDDAEDTNLSHKKSNKHVDKSDLNSDDYLEQSRYTLGGTMCDSLSEPPPEMFEMPEVNSYNERNGSNIPLYLQSTPDPKDDDGMDASIQAESSSEGSCEIPLQPKIVAKSVDLSEESDL